MKSNQRLHVSCAAEERLIIVVLIVIIIIIIILIISLVMFTAIISIIIIIIIVLALVLVLVPVIAISIITDVLIAVIAVIVIIIVITIDITTVIIIIIIIIIVIIIVNCYHYQHTGCLPCYSQRCRPQHHANNSFYTGCVRWCLLRRRPNSNVDNWPHNVVRRCVSSPLAHSWSWPIANLIIGWPMSNVILGAADKHVTSVTWRRVEGGAQRLVSLAAPRF